MNMLNSPAIPTDSEIITDILSGQTDKYEIIVRRYDAYLYRIGKSYGYEHEDVQDLMQDTYVQAFINLPAFEHRSSFLTWISRIMLNNCFHKKNKSSFKKEKSTAEVGENSLPMFNSNVSETKKILSVELKNVLETAITKIPANYRDVFVLRELNSMSIKETANALDISESNVKVRLNRAKTMLQKEITQTYSLDEVFEFNLIYCDAMVERVMTETKKLT